MIRLILLYIYTLYNSYMHSSFRITLFRLHYNMVLLLLYNVDKVLFSDYFLALIVNIFIPDRLLFSVSVPPKRLFA